MNACDHVGLSEDEQVIRALEVDMVVLKALTTIVGLFELMALDHRAHSSVDDDDAFGEQGFKTLHGRSPERILRYESSMIL